MRFARPLLPAQSESACLTRKNEIGKSGNIRAGAGCMQVGHKSRAENGSQAHQVQPGLVAVISQHVGSATYLTLKLDEQFRDWLDNDCQMSPTSK